MDNPKPREIKSFVLRQGRLTKAQQHAIDTLWPIYGIDTAESLLDFAQSFGNDHPVTLEIGFGNGETLAQMAKAAPERNFVGIEVHTPGVGHLLHLIQTQQLTNVRILNTDAVDIIKQRMAPNSLDRVQLYFPDPWHKKRHHKRRIVQPEFVQLIAERLKTGGIFHLATDWQDYALHMAEVMNASMAFKTLAKDGSAFSPCPNNRPLTKFEQRGLNLGHGVWDLLYQRV